MNETGPSVIVVTGPTACGKTVAAVRLARAVNGEIISADSRQVYRGLDIGSGKDLSEYSLGGKPVETHLIDIMDPVAEEPYTLADFMRDAKAAVHDIAARGKVPLICGGTALYLHALMKGYELPGGPADREKRKFLQKKDPAELLSELSSVPEGNGEDTNPYRLSRRLELEKSEISHAPSGGPIPGARYLVLGMLRPREEIRERILKRLDERFDEGMLDEVTRLHESGVSWEKLESFGLEYRDLSLHLEGKMTFEEMHEHLLTAIRRFAKRQDTFFRKMMREGINIRWLPAADFDEQALELAHSFLAEK